MVHHRKDIDLYPSIPQHKMLRILALMKLLAENNLSIETICESLGVSKRTAYRYIIMLRASDIEIPEIDGEFCMKKCPCCDKPLAN